MKHIIEKIKSAVQTNPAHFYSDSVEPILDTLYWHIARMWVSKRQKAKLQIPTLMQHWKLCLLI